MSLYPSESHSRSSSNGPTPIKMTIGGTPRSNKTSCTDYKVTPLTPTANLKILMSAVSPALREKERQEKEATSSQSKAVRAIFTSPKEVRKIENDYDRKAKSLGLLCRKFLTMTESDIGTDSPFSLEAVANTLGINRRRIYDIVNIFESLELVEKHSKNLYVWHGVEGLPVTLGKLKAIAELEGPMIFCDRPNVLLNPEFQWRMKGGEYYNKFNLGVQEEEVMEKPLSQTLSGSEWQGEAFPLQREDDDGEEEKKNDRSLGLLCQKFIMLLLVLPESEVTLDFAAQVILADDETIDMTGRAKPKVRRLYDIANVLVSMGLIAKDHYISTTEGCHKPGFYWIGPDISDTSHIVVTRKPDIELLRGRKCSSKSIMSILGRKHLCGTKHSLLNCFNIKVLDSPTTRTPQKEKVKSHSAPSSPICDRDLGMLKRTKKAILSTTPLELEAVLFGLEMKPLEQKYPKVYNLVSEYLKKSCGESVPTSTPSVIRNPVNSEDKNEPVYIFNNLATSSRRQGTRLCSDGQRLVIAGVKRVNSEPSSLPKRKLSEDLDDVPDGSLGTEETPLHLESPVSTTCIKKSTSENTAPTSILTQTSPTLPNPSELFQQLNGITENFSPSVFLKVPQFVGAAQKIGTTCNIAPHAHQPAQSVSRVLVRPLGSVVSPAGMDVPIHQLVTGITPQVQLEQKQQQQQQQQQQFDTTAAPQVSVASMQDKQLRASQPNPPSKPPPPHNLDEEDEYVEECNPEFTEQETPYDHTMDCSLMSSQSIDTRPCSLGVSVSPASTTTPTSVLPPHSGSVLPPNSGSVLSPHSGSVLPPHSGSVLPPNSGSVLPPHSGSVLPPNSGSVLPPHSGSVLPPHSGSVLPPHSGSITTPQELNTKLLQALQVLQAQPSLSQQLLSTGRMPLFNPTQLNFVNALQSCIPSVNNQPHSQAIVNTPFQALVSQLTNPGNTVGYNLASLSSSQANLPAVNVPSTLSANSPLDALNKTSSTSAAKLAIHVPLKPKKTASKKVKEPVPKRPPLADVPINIPKPPAGKPSIQPTPNLASLLTQLKANISSTATQSSSSLENSFASRLNSALHFLASTNITLNEDTAELLARLLQKDTVTTSTASDSTVLKDQVV